ncbi:MAG TPA: cytochrome b/b6 domain-containing protein [Steroidobacteraceae bacterium]|nr:cytochrome b/b6 domain-containing protein [Steroidobacteraceae bacterium]
MSTPAAEAVADTRDRRPPPRREIIRRHSWPVRLTHWVNALTIFIMVGSGLDILNAHPRLYWGKAGDDFDKPFLALHAWPRWITIPSYPDLADARHWHFFFAWILVANGALYLAWSFGSRHIQRDIWPRVSDLRAIPRSIVDHVRLRHPKGDAAKRYNVLQRLAYLGLLALAAGMVLTGLCMSPGFDAFAPWLVDVLGGRQSARTLHFLFASAIVLFIAVHLIEVVLAGPINEVRSMITGRYAVPPEDD